MRGELRGARDVVVLKQVSEDERQNRPSLLAPRN